MLYSLLIINEMLHSYPVLKFHSYTDVQLIDEIYRHLQCINSRQIEDHLNENPVCMYHNGYIV
jgi:hypothetical protein